MRADDCGITGSTSAQTTRSASAALYSVASSSGRDAGVFASAQGSRTTMYLLSAEISSQMPRSAALKSKRAASASVPAIAAVTACRRSASSAVSLPAARGGTAPSQ